jgi:hypothetical protein
MEPFKQVRLPCDGGGQGRRVTGSLPFPTGLLDGQATPGRPVDVQPPRDGSLLASDDDNGAIHRISYKAKERWDALPEKAFRHGSTRIKADRGRCETCFIHANPCRKCFDNPFPDFTKRSRDSHAVDQ